MAKYTGTILTNKGKELLARAILGEVIVFTKVEIGKGIISQGTKKETLTALVDSFKILSITSTSKLPNGGYRIRISFNNKGFVNDTYLREIGVFAKGKDGTEILYSYCNTDTPNLIPNEHSGKIESVEDIITYISSAATINAVIDQSNVYATIKDLVEGLATKENIFNKNGAFNKSFGTTQGTVMEGNKRATDLGGEAAFTKKTAFNRNFSHVISSTSKVLVASAYAVKIAYDKGAAALSKAITAQNTANLAQTKANQAYSLANGKEPKFTKKDAFNRSFSHVINSTSKVLVASAYAVKIAYDKAVEAVGFTNINKNAIHNNKEQIENLNDTRELITTYEKRIDGVLTISESVFSGKSFESCLILIRDAMTKYGRWEHNIYLNNIINTNLQGIVTNAVPANNFTAGFLRIRKEGHTIIEIIDNRGYRYNATLENSNVFHGIYSYGRQ